jgi:hypothetical protein
MKRISYVLNTFDLLQELVGLELLGQKFQLVLGVKEFFFGLIQLILESSVFVGIDIKLIFEA